jgi:hypothetical protein
MQENLDCLLIGLPRENIALDHAIPRTAEGARPRRAVNRRARGREKQELCEASLRWREGQPERKSRHIAPVGSGGERSHGRYTMKCTGLKKLQLHLSTGSAMVSPGAGWQRPKEKG